MSDPDSKSLDSSKVSPVDPEVGVGEQRNTLLDAAMALRRVGIAAFFFAVVYSTPAYVQQPHGRLRPPEWFDMLPGLCCQHGSTMTLTVFNKIKKREAEVTHSSTVWKERLSLLLGFVLMTSGVMASIHRLLQQYSYIAYANVFQCGAIIASLAIVLVAKGHIAKTV